MQTMNLFMYNCTICNFLCSNYVRITHQVWQTGKYTHHNLCCHGKWSRFIRFYFQSFLCRIGRYHIQLSALKNVFTYNYNLQCEKQYSSFNDSEASRNAHTHRLSISSPRGMHGKNQQKLYRKPPTGQLDYPVDRSPICCKCKSFSTSNCDSII